MQCCGTSKDGLYALGLHTILCSFSCFFSVRLLSVLRGHSVFSSPAAGSYFLSIALTVFIQLQNPRNSGTPLTHVLVII